VQIDAVKQARTQLESNERLVEKGVLAPIDVVAATAQIATFEQNVYAAQEEVTRAENSLKVLIASERTTDLWSQAITPVSPVSLVPPRNGLDAAMTEALANRPEMAQFEANAEINRIDQRFFLDQTRPQIDLVGSYTAQGLAGSETPNATDPNTGMSRVPPNLVGGYLNSLGNLFAQDYPAYRIGITITLPWGNTTARANLGRSIVEGNRIANQRAQTEQIIEAEVRNSIQALRSAEARLASASASRSAAEKLFESEERQFRSGTTTFYLVLQRQIELVTARGRELQAQTDLNKAISEFRRSTGSTLSANSVNVTDGRNLIQDERRIKLAVNSRFFEIDRSK
jgi:HAE1 family hydrophobic/amphiphilic exporter-1